MTNKNSTALRHSIVIIKVVIFSIVITSACYAGEETVNLKSILAGKKLYLHGEAASGDSIVSTTFGDVKLSGKKAACVNCHRHSGLGSIEGSTIAPAITGEILFKEKRMKAHRYHHTSSQSTFALDRPAYTKESLKNTLISGVDSSGKQLDKLMPRYTLSEDDYKNLFAYLNSLSIDSKGVTDTTLHIATIIDSRADAGKSNTMLKTLEQYFADLNAQTRREIERTEQAPIQKEWLYGGYRLYELDIWNLDGAPETWNKQLNDYYGDQPVFAIVSGISKDSWHSVDEFCNDKEIPCILPNIKTPGFSKNNLFTLYFNSGPFNDASVLTAYFNAKASASKSTFNIVQLFDTAVYSGKAKKIFSEGISGNDKIKITDMALEKIDDDKFKQLLSNIKSSDSTSIIIWADELAPSLIKKLKDNKNRIKSVFIPYYLATDAKTREKLKNIGIEVYTSYPYVAPENEARATIRSTAWGRSKKIDMTEKAVFTNTFTAIKLLMAAIKHARSNYNSAYIIELLEHKLDKAVVTGMYPKLSIGPNQRYASRGGYVMLIPTDDTDSPLVPLSKWILPTRQIKLTQQ